MELRQRYMKSSFQTFHPTAERHIREAKGKLKKTPEEVDGLQLSVDAPYHPPPPEEALGLRLNY